MVGEGGLPDLLDFGVDCRRSEREPGKSDQIDARAIARAVLRDGIQQFPAAFLGWRASLRYPHPLGDGTAIVFIVAGNRKLNRALHIIAITRGRLDPETRAYLQRKEAEGKSRMEAMRCLKRHLARRYYRLLSERSRSTGLLPSHYRLLSCTENT